MPPYVSQCVGIDFLSREALDGDAVFGLDQAAWVVVGGGVMEADIARQGAPLHKRQEPAGCRRYGDGGGRRRIVILSLPLL